MGVPIIELSAVERVGDTKIFCGASKSSTSTSSTSAGMLNICIVSETRSRRVGDFLSTDLVSTFGS